MSAHSGALELEIPGLGTYRLIHAVFDVNGTVCLDGQLVPGVREALAQLSRKLAIHFITADTHGTMRQVEQELGIHMQKLNPGGEAEQKRQLVRQLGAESVVAIGNGANDVLMLKEAAIGIAVIGPEGVASQALLNAGVVAPDILSALELLLKPKRLIATLRR